MESAPTPNKRLLSEVLDELLSTHDVKLGEPDFEQGRRPLDQVTSPAEFIEAVNFDTINDIFDKLVEKSVGDTKVRNSGHRVRPDRIHLEVYKEGDVLPEAAGTAEVDYGFIELMWDERLQNTTQRSLYALAVLMHESAHIRGGYKHERQTQEDLTVKHRYRIGLQESTSSILEEEEIKGLSLSEAITENISQEVFFEYLRRTGDTRYLENWEVIKMLGDGGYEVDRIALALVVGALAESLEIDKDLIWGGFVAAYMNGNTELPALLEDMQRELVKRPEVIELVSLLASDKRLEDRNEVLKSLGDPGKTWNPFKKIKIYIRQAMALKEVVYSFDPARFKNVLGLS